MRFRVLALDFDGTIAVDGQMDPSIRPAIAEVRARGITVILVTGRILDELRGLVGDLRFVDAVVAENGAVIAFPHSGQSWPLAGPAPPALVQDLRDRGVSITVGSSVIEAPADAAAQALRSIRALELPQVIVFNRQRLMILPSGVNKASGLREALLVLRLSPHNAMAIGDAENDHALLDLCEVGVAVKWGSKALQARADVVLAGDGPAAIARYIRDAACHPRLPSSSQGRRAIVLGSDAAHRPVSLAVRGRNVIVAGDPKSGKSWVAGLICEQLILARYSTCVIDPEGDYSGLEALPGVITLGGTADGPTPRELRTALRYPDVNVVLQLSHMAHAKKWSYIRALLPALASLRRRTGVPHRILLDEAHYFLNAPDVAAVLDLELAGYTLVTYQPSQLPPAILDAGDLIVTTRLSDPRELDALARRHPLSAACLDDIAHAELGRAVLLPDPLLPGAEATRVRLARRLTPHVRHHDKYIDMPVAHERAFRFLAAGSSAATEAASLQEFIREVGARQAADLHAYLVRGDFSHWIGDVLGDPILARELREIESAYLAGRLPGVSDAIVQAVRQRYAIVETPELQPSC